MNEIQKQSAVIETEQATMSNLLSGMFKDYEIRWFLKDDAAWWIAKDICSVLEYSNFSKAISDHVDSDEKDVITVSDSIGRKQSTPIINESGLYSLILRSRKPQAKEFKKWITKEILPSIRKTGTFTEKKKTYEEIMQEALLLADGKVKELKNQIEYNQPKVDYANAVSGAVNPINLRDWINSLKSDLGLTVGEKKVIKYLITKKILYRNKDKNLRVYSKYSQYFKLVPFVVFTINGSIEKMQLKITGEGQLIIGNQIINFFKQNFLL